MNFQTLLLTRHQSLATCISNHRTVIGAEPDRRRDQARRLLVDQAAVDAARGMGFRSMRILTEVEIPCALPLMLSGIRSAVLQIVSTATVAAYISLGGLGRLLIDGKAQSDYGQMAAGAVLVSLIALVFDLGIGALTARVVSPGLTRRDRKKKTEKPAATSQRTAVPEPAPI